MAQNTYSFKLKNGKTLDVNGPEPPSDEEIEGIANEAGVELALADEPPSAPPVNTPPITPPQQQVIGAPPSAPQKPNIEVPPSMLEKGYRMLMDAPEFITAPAKRFSDLVTEPSNEDESYWSGVKARGKGFVGGAAEGIASQLSPANILTMGRSRLANIAAKALGGTQIAHGGHELYEGNTAEGLGDIGWGLLSMISGMDHSTPSGPKPNIPSPDMPVRPNGPSLPPDNMNQAAILEAIKAPIVNHPRPEGVWDNNLGQSTPTPPAGITPDKMFEMARQNKGMGEPLPEGMDQISGPIKEAPAVDLEAERQRFYELAAKEQARNISPREAAEGRALHIRLQEAGGLENGPQPKVETPHPNTEKDAINQAFERGEINEEVRDALIIQDDKRLATEQMSRIPPKKESTIQHPNTEKDAISQAFDRGEINQEVRDALITQDDRRLASEQARRESTIKESPSTSANRGGKGITPEQLAANRARMDAKNKGFKGNAPEELPAGSGNSNIPPNNDLPVSMGGEPPPIDPERMGRITEAAKLLDEPEKKSLWRIARDAQRDILTSFDFSAPGRQGKGLITHPEYWKALDDMVMAWGSKRATEAIDASIINHPSGYFKPQTLPNGEIGPSFAEQVGLKLSKEELFQSNLQDELPKQIKFLGDPIARSGRAHRIFLKKTKADVFAKLMDQAKSEGRDLTKNLPVAQKIADSINVSAGRGSFGRLENPSVNIATGKMEAPLAMKILNEAFFSPHFQKSRLDMYTRILNPRTYMQSDPIVRKEAWRSLLGVMGTAFLTQELARQAGAQINNDPKSSDFRKIKFGESRIDNMSGLQQYGVNTARFMLGKSTASSPENYGKVTDLRAGKYGQQTREDVVLNFVTNKLAPIPSLLVAWMRGREFDGMPFEMKRALAMRIAPIVMQDLKELYDSDPNQFPEGFLRENPWITKTGLGLMPLVGEGLQTYGR